MEIVHGDDRIIRGSDDMDGDGEIIENIPAQCIGFKVFLVVSKGGVSGDDGIGHFHAGPESQDITEVISGREEGLLFS